MKTPKEKGLPLDHVARVSRYGRQLRNMAVCYDPSVSYRLSINLTMCLYALGHHSLTSWFSRVSSTHKFVTNSSDKIIFFVLTLFIYIDIK